MTQEVTSVPEKSSPEANVTTNIAPIKPPNEGPSVQKARSIPNPALFGSQSTNIIQKEFPLGDVGNATPVPASHTASSSSRLRRVATAAVSSLFGCDQQPTTTENPPVLSGQKVSDPMETGCKDSVGGHTYDFDGKHPPVFLPNKYKSIISIEPSILPGNNRARIYNPPPGTDTYYDFGPNDNGFIHYYSEDDKHINPIYRRERKPEPEKVQTSMLEEPEPYRHTAKKIDKKSSPPGLGGAFK